MKFFKSAVRRAVNSLGFDLVRRGPGPERNGVTGGKGVSLEEKLPEYPIPEDFTEEDRALISLVRSYTLTSPERIYALAQAVRYIVRHEIPGDIVECGVWRGGSMMVVARVLRELGDAHRHLYLFDTFEGMTPPTEKDTLQSGIKASQLLATEKKEVATSLWCRSPLDEVKQNLSSTGFDLARVHLVKGRVEDTVPGGAPSTIAILRLDTDWYESTRHELIHLFPRLVSGGILLLDDYGWWKGAQLATDEYLAQNNTKLLLTRLDSTGGRIAVKP